MKPILLAKVLNPYRRKYKWYDPIKGHTGVDLAYNFEELPSPVTGKVVKFLNQEEMGKTLYVEDTQGKIHVFAHLSKVIAVPGDMVTRNEIIAVTGNTGSVTSGPHLHWEIICVTRPKKITEWAMTRKLGGFKGWNVNPTEYLRGQYQMWHIAQDGRTFDEVNLNQKQ